MCQPVVLGNGSKRELSYKNKDAEAFGAKIFYCLAQQVTKEQRKKKVAPVSFHFYSNKRSETCWSSWWLALAELFPKKGFPSLLTQESWEIFFEGGGAFCVILWQHWSIWVEEGGIRLGWAGWSARVPFLVIVSTEHSSSENFLITLKLSLLLEDMILAKFKGCDGYAMPSIGSHHCHKNILRQFWARWAIFSALLHYISLRSWLEI